MDPAAELQTRIDNRTARIGIIGLGYVGLPLLRVFWDAGYPVIGLDIDQDKIDQLSAGNNYLPHLGETLVSDMLAERFEVTSDLSRLAELDAILICVPTPLDERLEPDLSYVEKTADDVATTLKAGQLIVLISTTYPGTTRDVLLPHLETNGGAELKCGKDFFLAYAPEREDPGRKDHTTRSIPKLVGGVDPVSTQLACTLFGHAVDQVIEVGSAEVAEAAKILENVYRAVNIALVNELKTLLTQMDIDVWQVVEAASTKPFGFQPFFPGPGLGGHCIPIDPFYLSWKARQMGLNTQFIELAGRVNRQMPDYVVQRLCDALDQKGQPIQNAKALILGIAYKPDVDDVRESPSFELIEKLQALGAAVDYHDPHVPATHQMRHHDLHMKSVDLTPQTLADYDCVLIATHHSAYDWQMIADHARLIIDTRNAMKDVKGKRDHIVQA